MESSQNQFQEDRNVNAEVIGPFGSLPRNENDFQVQKS